LSFSTPGREGVTSWKKKRGGEEGKSVLECQVQKKKRGVYFSYSRLGRGSERKKNKKKKNLSISEQKKEGQRASVI